MAIINLTSTTGSGFLEADFDQIKELLQDGGTTPGTTSPLATKTGTETFTNKTLTGATLTGAAIASAAITTTDITGGTLTSAVISGGTLSSAVISGGTLTSVNFSNPAAFYYYDAGNTGASQTIDWNNGAYQKSTLTGNCAYTFTAPSTGSGRCVRLELHAYQDTTGSRVPTWPASVKWSAGGTAPTLTTTASKADIIVFVFDGTNYAATATTNFAI